MRPVHRAVAGYSTSRSKNKSKDNDKDYIDVEIIDNTKKNKNIIKHFHLIFMKLLTMLKQ